MDRGEKLVELPQIAKELYEAGKQLPKASEELISLAEDMALAEKDYRMALGSEEMTLKAMGMSVTLIPDIARGNTADLKFYRDLSEAKWKAGLRKVIALEAQLTSLQSLLKLFDNI